jgi:hypothetical protein
MDFAQATLISEVTRQSPILIELGYEPRMSFDWTREITSTSPNDQLNRQDAQDRVKALQQA